jgi:hypothetical protein
MKKLLYLLFAICLIGCSDDDGISDTAGTDTQLLVKSINWTRTNEGTTDNGSEEFTYDGNKIVQVRRTSSINVDSYNYTDKYIYTDNLISRISSYNFNEELQEQTFLEYDNSDRLIYIEVEKNGQLEYYASLEYGSSNTSFTYTAIGVSNVFFSETTECQIDSNGNIVSFEGNGIDEQSMNCSYDNKHNPFKNIIGKGTSIGFFGHHFSNSLSGWLAENNIITLELIDFNDLATDDDDDLSTYSLSYDYNNEDYPRNISWEDNWGANGTEIIEYY